MQSRKERRRAEREAKIDRHFREYERWLRDSVETEDEPYMQILAVVTGDTGEPLEPDSGRADDDDPDAAKSSDELSPASPT